MRIVLLCVFFPALVFAQFALPRNFTSRASPGPIPLPNTIGCYGDSIIAGACQNVNVCVRVSNAIAGSTSVNDGVSGYTAAQISTCYFDGVPGTCDPYATQCNGEPCGTLIIQGGVNSLKAVGAVTGVVEAATLAQMQPIVEDALGRGRRVAWIGVLPYASCDALTCPELVDPDERATTYNSLASAACVSLQSSYGSALLKCVFPYADFAMLGPAPDFDPGYLKTEYACSDGIHLQDTSGKTGPQTLACDVLTALGVACP
jgi:hypothetical protein